MCRFCFSVCEQTEDRLKNEGKRLHREDLGDPIVKVSRLPEVNLFVHANLVDPIGTGAVGSSLIVLVEEPSSEVN